MTDLPLDLPTTIAGVRVRTLLAAIHAWAADRPDVVAVALVGSWTRGAARPDSDVDLVLVVRDVAGYLAFPAWLDAFGKRTDTAHELTGALPTLRVWYADGPEVEFALSTPTEMAAAPVAHAAADLVYGGMVALYDPEAALARLVAAVGQR